jgi:hypothetical protein
MKVYPAFKQFAAMNGFDEEGVSLKYMTYPTKRYFIGWKSWINKSR